MKIHEEITRLNDIVDLKKTLSFLWGDQRLRSLKKTLSLDPNLYLLKTTLLKACVYQGFNFSKQTKKEG